MHPVYGMCQELPEGCVISKMNVSDMFPNTGDIHSGVPGHVEVVSLLQKMSNTRERTIKTRTVEMQEKGLIRRENGKCNGRWEVLVII